MISSNVMRVLIWILLLKIIIICTREFVVFSVFFLETLFYIHLNLKFKVENLSKCWYKGSFIDVKNNCKFNYLNKASWRLHSKISWPTNWFSSNTPKTKTKRSIPVCIIYGTYTKYKKINCLSNPNRGASIHFVLF